MQRASSLPKLIGLLLMPISIAILAISSIGANEIIGPPLSITILLLANVLFLLGDASNNVLFLAFQGTFFIFVVAGPLLDAFDGIVFFGSFASDVALKTYICYWLVAFAMWCYCLYRTSGKREIVFGIKNKENKPEQAADYNYSKIRFWSKILFYIAIVAYIAVTFDKIFFRQVYSLQAYYANYDASLNLPWIVVKIADCHLIALALFLATKPTKREAKAPIIVFIIASALTLLYGVRNVIILNALFLIIYFVMRNNDDEEIWLSKRAIRLGLVLSPILVIFLQAFDAFRRSIAFSVFDMKGMFSLSLIRDFFVSQSVSSNILPNAITHFDQLGGQPVPYTFGTLYTYLTQNMITRLFTGAAAFNSNSVESAMHSANLGSRLAYNMYRETYLSGTGMGGNFVADLFVDFSFIGVFVGTILACMIARKLTKIIRRGGYNSPYILAFALVAIRWFVYMPRDSYFSWAMQAFSFMNIIFVLMVMFISQTKMPFHATSRMTDS